MAKRSEGPTPATCRIVDERDEFRCQRCGASLASVTGSRHHRQLRRSGDHRPSNLILLCGSGTTGCHGWAHANPAAARREGLIVPSWAASEFVPVKTYSGWLRLVPDGSAVELGARHAERLLRDLGLLS